MSPVSNSYLKRALKLSQYPFSHGEPDTISAVFDLTALIHAWIALATNSGQLSDRMKAGTLRMMNSRWPKRDWDGSGAA